MSDLFPGGTYTALIMGCGWVADRHGCEHCWARGGWDGIEPRRLLNPLAVAERLELGMRSLGLTACRITGGEPTTHWDHVLAVIDAILSRRTVTATSFVLETHGADLTADRIAALKDILADRIDRFLLVVGVKATSPERLAHLTGMPAGQATITHTRQLQAVFRAARAGLRVIATFIDRFTDADAFAAIRAELTCANAASTEIQPFVTHRGWAAPR
jgi:uncharacterized Fe-S cluster-containing radical SAM superfamily protein